MFFLFTRPEIWSKKSKHRKLSWEPAVPAELECWDHCLWLSCLPEAACTSCCNTHWYWQTAGIPATVKAFWSSFIPPVTETGTGKMPLAVTNGWFPRTAAHKILRSRIQPSWMCWIIDQMSLYWRLSTRGQNRCAVKGSHLDISSVFSLVRGDRQFLVHKNISYFCIPDAVVIQLSLSSFKKFYRNNIDQLWAQKDCDQGVN